MTVVSRKLTSVFDSASGLYESGDYPAVLQLLSGAADPRSLALLANANLKLGNIEAAADIFAALSRLIPEKHGFFLKSAATLYLKARSNEKLAASAAKTILANPSDSKLAFEIIRATSALLDTAAIEPLLAHLNRSDPEQVYFISNFFRDRKKDEERSYAELVAGIEACPQDAFLRIQRFTASRIVSDFPTMRAFDTLMAEPRSPYAEQIFLHEMALHRLYWSDDERAQAQSSQDVQRLTARRAADNRGPRLRRPVSPASERLRIGYISNDFGHEVVMTVLKSTLERHDRTKFDITLFCYSNAEVRKHQQAWPEALRAMIVPIADLSDEAAAQAISAAKIDILVDLKGFTKGDRLGIMGISDAPVTATFLGYPGSASGADIDYVISDPIVTPDTSRPYYAEKLCRLPEVQMPNDALAPVRATATRRSDWGLPDDRFVFASFNGQQKINPRTIDLWARILHSVPDSVFWIGSNNKFAPKNLLAEFYSLGIAEERIIFNEKVARFADHIGRVPLADLALDTLPYNGHSTTADMLRGGLPVLTVRGNSYHSRVSWSLLRSCGIDELAVSNDEDYCMLAAELARDPARLKEIRTRLDQNRLTSPLFNPDRMARHLERAFEMMADRARQDLLPDHIDVPALPI